jgi:hypothetical protein
MNKQYQSIWNESLGAWVAVSELDASRGKSSKGGTTGGVLRVRLLAASVALAYGCLPTTANAQLACLTTPGVSTVCEPPRGHSLTLGSTGDAAGARGALTLRGGGSGQAARDYFVGSVDVSAANITLGDAGLVNSTTRVLANHFQVGNSATTASGANSAAIGINALATHSNTLALGSGASAVAASALALGTNAAAGASGAAALGSETTASGESSVAVGGGNGAGNSANNNGAVASGDRSVAVGRNSGASAASTVAIGAGSTASGPGAIAIGGHAGAAATAAPASAGATATGSHSVALGGLSRATGHNALAVGFNANAVFDNDIAVGTNALARGNATEGAASIAFGHAANASGSGSAAFGKSASAKGENSAAFGHNAQTASGGAQRAGAWNRRHLGRRPQCRDRLGGKFHRRLFRGVWPTGFFGRGRVRGARIERRGRRHVAGD